MKEPKQREVAATKQQKKPPDKAAPGQKLPCQAKMDGKKAQPEHICTGCGACGNSRKKDDSLSPSLSFDLSKWEGATFSVSKDSAFQGSDVQEDKQHVCTGCGACGSSAALKDAASLDLGSLEGTQSPVLESAADNDAKVIPEIAPIVPEHKAIETGNFAHAEQLERFPNQEERLEAPTDMLIFLEALSPKPATEKILSAPKSPPKQFPLTLHCTAFQNELKSHETSPPAPLPPSLSLEKPTYAAPSETKLPEVKKEEVTNFPQKNGSPRIHPEKTIPQKIRIPKKRCVIGTYTYEDILASAWLRKMYGHLVGLSQPAASPERIQETPQENMKKRKKDKLDVSPLKKKRPSEVHTGIRAPAAKKEEVQTQEHNTKLPKTTPKHQIKIQNLRQEIAKLSQKIKALKKESHQINASLRKFKKEYALAKTEKAKEALESQIKKLQLQKSKIEGQLKDAFTHLKSLRKKITVAQAHHLLGRATLKTRAAIEKLKEGNPISKLTLNLASKKELRELKKLLENNKIVRYLLLHSQGKKRKSMLLRWISALLKALGGILGGK